MPRAAVNSLKSICIDLIAKDKETTYDFDGLVVSTLSFEVLKRKLDLYNTRFRDEDDPEETIELFDMNIEDIDKFIKPGLKKIDLTIPINNIGFIILKTIGRTQRALTHVRLRRNAFDDVKGDEVNRKMGEALLEFSKALKTVIQFDFQVYMWGGRFEFNWKYILRGASQLEYLDDIPYELSAWALKTFKRLKVLNARETLSPIFDMTKEDPDVKLNITNMIVSIDYDFPDYANPVEIPFGDQINMMENQLNHMSQPLEMFEFHTSEDNDEVDLSILTKISPTISTLNIQDHYLLDLNYIAHSILNVVKHHGSSLVILKFYHIQDIDLGHIIQHCPNLENLDVHDSIVEKDYSYMKHCAPLKKLKSLKMDFFNGRDRNEGDVSEQLWPLLLTENLKNLKIEHVKGSSLQKAFQRVCKIHDFPNLVELKLSFSNGLTFDDILPAIETSKNPLQFIDISDYGSYTDFGFSEDKFIEYAKRVKFANMRIKYNGRKIMH